MRGPGYYIINGITLYRLLVVPVLIYLIISNDPDTFKWLLPVSFFTDLIDGYLARRFKVTSILGSRLDSIADDLTIVSAIVGILVFKYWFVKQEIVLIAVMLVLYVIQTVYALAKYGNISSFHTYTAKVAAIFQGMFFILLFLLNEPLMWLFYAAVAMTIADLVEEIMLVYMLPGWEANVKGIYWVWKKKS